MRIFEDKIALALALSSAEFLPGGVALVSSIVAILVSNVSKSSIGVSDEVSSVRPVLWRRRGTNLTALTLDSSWDVNGCMINWFFPTTFIASRRKSTLDKALGFGG